MGNIAKILLINGLSVLVSAVTPDVLQSAMDKFLDVIEDATKNSENKIDDAVVLPICKTIRLAFKIEDND